MKCPYCSYSDSKVVDKRDNEDSSIIRRRRECLKCEKRFTTYEKMEVLDLTITKKDGTKEPYERAKLERGIRICLEKRQISEEKIISTVDKIEGVLRSLGKSEIPSIVIGKLVMKSLKKMDEVAYLRFVSVYKEFKDLSSFKEEIKTLQK